MKQAHIGVQMLTIKPLIEQHGLYEALRRCSEIGYHYIEVSWMALTPAQSVLSWMRILIIQYTACTETSTRLSLAARRWVAPPYVSVFCPTNALKIIMC